MNTKTGKKLTGLLTAGFILAGVLPYALGASTETARDSKPCHFDAKLIAELKLTPEQIAKINRVCDENVLRIQHSEEERQEYRRQNSQ